jgi:acyl carrier protein
MDDGTIEDTIINITADLFKKERSQITLETSFVEDLAADSLDTVEFSLAVEEAFDIEIPDSEASKVAKIKDIVNYVKLTRDNLRSGSVSAA